MGYRTVDEWGSFEFQNADVEAIRKERGHWYLELGYVTILPDRFCIFLFIKLLLTPIASMKSLIS